MQGEGEPFERGRSQSKLSLSYRSSLATALPKQQRREQQRDVRRAPKLTLQPAGRAAAAR